ncbi:MAG: hypothetical protein WBW31_07610 [Candidatus Sulfotelmatobacter sp.]
MHNTFRSHTSRPILARVAAVIPALAVCVTGLLCASAPALAEFSRPYISQITGTPTGLNGVQVPFEGLGGLTVDPRSDNVYVGSNGGNFADEFNLSDEFIEQLTGLSSGSLAFDDENGKLGGAVGGYGEAGNYVAVDDSTSSTDKARGDVYMTSVTSVGFEHRGFVQRVNMGGAPTPFTCLENGKTPEYINGAGELIGKPGEIWGEYASLDLMDGIAVDSGSATIASAGDIYVDIRNGNYENPVIASHVDEFTAEGCFVREFTEAMVPEKTPNGGGVFSSGIKGVAVDLTDGDVLIEALDSSENAAVDEFSESGEFLGKISGISKTDEFSDFGAGVGESGFGFGGISVSAEGDLYVDDSEFTGEYAGSEGSQTPVIKNVVDKFGKGAFYPRVVTGGVSGAHPGTVTLNGVVDGESHGLEVCRFEYISETAFKANDVNALQTLSVSGASGGGFSLSLDGQSTAAQGTGDLTGPAEGEGELIAGVNDITGLNTISGTFLAGEQISGTGIPAGTTILSVHAGTIVLSSEAEASGAVTLKAGSDEITGLATTSGSFVEGQEVSGPGIPAGTTIVALNRVAGTLTLSSEITAGGNGVALSSAIPYDPSAAQVSAALENLPAIGSHNVSVTGSAGGPFTIEFVGARAHTDIPQLNADSSGLTPAPGASATVASTREGGDGWAHLAGSPACAPEASKIAKEGNQPVHAEIKGLTAGTVYDYRLEAGTNLSEHGATLTGDLESFAAPAKPLVEDVSVDDVSSSWVDFHGVLDPLGEDTTYHFEYLSAAAFATDGDSWGGTDPASSVPIPAVDIGSGDRSVSVNVQAGGLSASTTYEYRLVASNGEGTTDSANGVFATSPAAVPGLPDGRAYEMLTPPNKEDAEDMFGGPENIDGDQHEEEGLGGATNYDLGFSSEDGDHFMLLTTAAFGPFPSSGEGSYVFSRGVDGWSVQASASPSLGVQSGIDTVYDPLDFSVVGFHDNLVVGQGSKPVANLVGPAGGPYTTLQSGEEGASTTAEMVGASSNLSRVVLESADHGLASSEQERKTDSKQDAGTNALYEWSSTEGLQLVNLNPRGELLKCGAILGESGNQTEPEGGTHGAVSADGSEVFFTAPDPYEENAGSGCWNGGGENAPQLYAREDGRQTVEVSAPEKGVSDSSCAHPEEACHPAIFVGASKDGSKVFFLTQTELTKEAEKLGLHDMELYEYDIEAPEGERLTRVSAGEEDAPGRVSGAAVVNVPAVSSDGSAVYFNATGKGLTSTAPEGGGLYRYDTVTHTTRYVAPSGGYPALHEPQHAWYSSILGLSAVAGLSVSANYYTTGDGQFLVFPSTQNITGYAPAGKPELYRYHYEQGSPSGGSIVCVSCNPNGSAPSYGATFTRSALYGDNPAGTMLRPISENGQYMFFDTQESLLPADTNGKVDVYEWHEDPTSHEGTVSLITTGQDTNDSFFLDSSPDGKDVFFGTHSQLVPADHDNQGNLYDARIEGGFPAPLGAGPCEGDACQNPSPAPVYQTPTSLSFSGAGDVSNETAPSTSKVTKKTVAGKCKKPKQFSHGKCLKPKQKAKKAKKAVRTIRARNERRAGR